VNRSRTLACFLCHQIGATIGCAYEQCERLYHFSCGEDTGWRFDVNGKEFYCDLHRSIDREDSCRISLQYFRSKHPSPELLACKLCGSVGNENELGELLAFQRFSKSAAGQEQLVVVHEKCVRYTSIIDIGEDTMSRFDKEFRNVFTAIDRAQTCTSCGEAGATIRCSNHSCGLCYHFVCACNLGWNFDKQEPTFRCLEHREGVSSSVVTLSANDVNHNLQHSLFAAGAHDKNRDEPRSLGTDVSRPLAKARVSVVVVDSSDDDSDDLQDSDSKDETGTSEAVALPASIPLALPSMKNKLNGTRQGIVRLVRITRETVHDRWNVDLYATCSEGSAARVLTVASSVPDPYDQLEAGDIVTAFNGIRVGSPELDSLQKAFAFLSREIETMLEVRRYQRPATQWY
jgi:PHD-like zinc-binding domain/PHD-zinc-finger like domain